MCGIAGVLRIHDPGTEPPPIAESIPEHWLDVLDASIRHRGPDGQGRFRDRVTRPDGKTVDVALVHRRLSILDHAGGGQPMVQGGDARLFGPTTPTASAPAGPQDYRTIPTHICPKCREERDGLVAVVFNGCIYNHRELRRELEAAGHVFESDHSDTEVILHGSRQWPVAIVDRLDGMFSMAVWDRASATLVVARDAFGEKPLYVRGTRTSSLIGFASTCSALLKLNRHLPPIDDDASSIARQLSGWIQFGWNQGARVATGISSTFAGYAEPLGEATGDESKWIQWPHAVLNPSGEPISPSQVDTAMRHAVASRLDADVSLGCFLSGGLDSALVAKYAAEQRPDLETYTVRMPHADLDESEAAAATARHLGLRHTILDCEADPAADLVSLIPQLGLPFGDSSLLPTHWVSRAARQHVRVALAGDGGDELFLGYDRHRAIRLLDRLSRLPQSRREDLASLPLSGRRPASKSTRAQRLLAASTHLGYKELVAIFPTPMLVNLGFEPRHRDHWGMTMTSRDDDTTERTARRFDLLFYLPEDLLRKTDTASMACALEVRAPLLARVVAEPAINAPLTNLMPRGQRKGLLKQVARKYLPASIVDRPKMGFAIPIGDWFRTDYGSMRTLLYDHLESTEPFPGLADAGVDINMTFVRQMLREHDAAGETSINPWHGRDHSQRLYMLLVLSIWAKWLAGLNGSASGQRPAASAG